MFRTLVPTNKKRTRINCKEADCMRKMKSTDRRLREGSGGSDSTRARSRCRVPAQLELPSAVPSTPPEAQSGGKGLSPLASLVLPSKNTQGPNSCCSCLHVLTPSEVDKDPRVYFFQKNKPFIHKRSTKSKALKEKCHFTSKERFSHFPSFFTPFPVPAQAECPLSPKALTQAQGSGLSSLNRRGRGHGIRKRTWRKCTCVHGAPVFASRA